VNSVWSSYYSMWYLFGSPLCKSLRGHAANKEIYLPLVRGRDRCIDGIIRWVLKRQVGSE
jgi:hypothetical protein